MDSGACKPLRIYVMHEGKIVGEFSAGEVTQEKVMQCIFDSEVR